MKSAFSAGRLTAGDCIRRLLIAWLAAVLLAYILLPAPLQSLQGLEGVAAASPLLLLGVGLGALAALVWVGCRRDTRGLERWLLFGLTALLGLWSGIRNPRPAYLGALGLLLPALWFYARRGWNGEAPAPLPAGTHGRRFRRLTAGAAGLMFLVLAGWGILRVRSLSVPTFDFGIFTQMYERMRAAGQPLTTLERDGLLSHFAVHVSPVYYLLLPFYALWPYPETLQILQAALMVGAVIPLWLLARELGFGPVQRFLFCLLLLLAPFFIGAVNYDLHENTFLTLFLLWLFYAAKRRSLPLTLLFALLTLTVKEDASVYVAVFGLFLVLRGLLFPRACRWELGMGLALGAVSAAWFLGASALLRARGDGPMNNRYENLDFTGSGSLVSVVQTLLRSPMKGLYECTEPGKLPYLAATMGPLLALPLLSRRYERCVLLIPLVLINLLSDYEFQHSVFYQYSFGTAAFLMLLTLLNLRDLLPALEKRPRLRLAPQLACLAVCLVCFCAMMVPRIRKFAVRIERYGEAFSAIEERLDAIPRDVPVTASRFLTVPLRDVPELYDWQYSSEEHILSSEYVILQMKAFDAWYTPRALAPVETGRAALIQKLEEAGFLLADEYGDWLRIYRKPAS